MTLHEHAKLLREQGLSYAEIGKKVGKTRHTVRRWLDPVAHQKYKEMMRKYTGTVRHKLSSSRSLHKKRGVGKPCITPPADIKPQPLACELCGRVGSTHLDHCHLSGEFRGWLCGQCNRVLGLIGDSTNSSFNWMLKAIAYLRRTK